jgi:1-acyl-sn-glycerol-3-phosphate acyltransferase
MTFLAQNGASPLDRNGDEPKAPARSAVFFLTGVTGFLGKVVLEELLRRQEELAIERILVVIRPKGRRNAEDRFRREVAESPCLSGLPAQWAQRVTVLDGTLEKPQLGLAPGGLELLRDVTHIVNTAASVNFNLPIADAARANILTSLNMLELARACPKLVRLISVSTAYVTPHPGNGTPIQEILAPLPVPAEELYASIQNGAAVDAAMLARSGHPNTYTLTKAIAEHLLVERRGTIPLTILRPSIISASRQTPFPGWIDSASGFGAFVVLLGLGHLRAVIGDSRARLDLVPVDEVAQRIVLSCQNDSGPLQIRHAVAGLEISRTVAECWKEILQFFRVHRVARRPERRYLGPGGAPFQMANFFHHRLPIALAGARSPELKRRAGQLGARLTHLNRVFPYFTSRSFDFQSSIPLERAVDDGGYVTTVCRGVYRHLLKQDETEWPLAGRSHLGHGGDLRWALTQPHGNAWIRTASWLVTKVLRRAVDRVTVDIPSFEAARRAAPPGTALVLVPNHRSYLDFVLCSYLAFARPDLGIPIPHIAATMEFGRIPVLGAILRSMHAFYLRRGVGREDPDLTRRVHALIRAGRTLEFFIEGERSRSRVFLPPKRGLLRCLQATGQTCVLVPIALTYDRIPEERAFARELAGHPKPKMRLRALLSWAVDVWRGRIDLGRIHVACGSPVTLDRDADAHAVSHQVIQQLREATVATTYHLEAYLAHHSLPGEDFASLRYAIEERGGRVLESRLKPPKNLDPLIAGTLRQQFVHHLNGAADGDSGVEPSANGWREPEPVG